MRRPVGTVFLLAFLAMGLGRVSLAGDAPPAADAAAEVARIGRMLLAPDAQERARGAALLLERVRQGGDLAGFVAALADAQARHAWSEAHVREVLVRRAEEGTPQERARARVLLDLLGPVLERIAAAEESAKAGTTTASPAPPLPPPGTPAPSAPATQAAQELSSLRVPARVGVFVADRLEVEGACATTGALGLLVPSLAQERPLALAGAPARDVAALLAALPGARPVLEGQAAWVESAPTVLVAPEVVPWRERVVRTPEGAWAVESSTLPRGLAVEASVADVAGATFLRLVLRHTEVPQPFAVTRERPAADVEPVEVDRPEWRTSSATVDIPWPPADGDALAVIPAVAPGGVVVVRLASPPALPPR